MGERPEDHGIRAVIDGQHLSLYVDYDRPRLAKLSLEGKVEYLERRFNFVVLEPLAILLDDDVYSRHSAEREAQVLLVWGNTIMCAIEALGHFITDATATNAGAFLAFVTAFMDPSWRDRPVNRPSGIDSYARWLWDSFRNGLAHGAYVKSGGFEKLGDRMFHETERGLLKVDPWALDIDFRNGVKKMSRSLREPENYFRRTFEVRFNWTYVQGES